MMRSIRRRYVGSLNACCRRTGTLWEGNLNSALADRERYALACYAYIDAHAWRLVTQQLDQGLRKIVIK